MSRQTRILLIEVFANEEGSRVAVHGLDPHLTTCPICLARYSVDVMGALHGAVEEVVKRQREEEEHDDEEPHTHLRH